MVRQLAPTAQGVPIEIYAFTADKKWENYEQIMSDIFDHLLASISYFDLECFEYSYPRIPKNKFKILSYLYIVFNKNKSK